MAEQLARADKRNRGSLSLLLAIGFDHLVQGQRWPSIEGLPTLAETMKDAASIPGPVEILEGIIKEDEENRLY